MAIAPETGAYLNEASVLPFFSSHLKGLIFFCCFQANPFDVNWKQDFYGVNYDRLLQVKDKWDPYQMLYGPTAVGGDRWVTVDGGGLCPVVG